MTLGRAGLKTRRIKRTSFSPRPCPLPPSDPPARRHRARPRQPTLLITNRDALPPKQVSSHYARRMNIEQRLAEAIRSFRLDALAGAVPLNVDLDVVLSVLAHTLCAALRRRLPGYATATPTPCNADSSPPAAHPQPPDQIVVRLDRRTYSPVLRQADLPETITVPWWDGRTLRYEYA